MAKWSSNLDRDTIPPNKVEVMQVGVEKCGIASQMSKILEQFLRDVWPKKVPVKRVREKDLPPVVGRDKDIATLVEMGFRHTLLDFVLSIGSMTQAVNACRMTKNLQEATNLLINNPSKCEYYEPPSKQSQPNKGKKELTREQKMVPVNSALTYSRRTWRRPILPPTLVSLYNL